MDRQGARWAAAAVRVAPAAAGAPAVAEARVAPVGPADAAGWEVAEAGAAAPGGVPDANHHRRRRFAVR